MRTVIIIFQTMFTGLGGFIGWYLGGWDGFLYALLTFVVADYVTGVACAVIDHKVSSGIGFRGITRKVLIFVLVGLANLLDVYVLGEGGVLRTAVIFFYISNEGISLIENAAHLGLPVPGALRDALASLTGNKDPDPAPDPDPDPVPDPEEGPAPGGADPYTPKHDAPAGVPETGGHFEASNPDQSN